MVRIMVAPGKYVQAPRILEKAGEYIAPLGSRVFLVSDPLAWPLVEKQISASLDEQSIAYRCELFSGTCNMAEADVLSDKARAFGADVVAGVGGGSALDLAKAVFAQIRSAIVTIPTAASNDSPCSALAVMYDKNHRLDVVLRLDKNPDLVLVDSKVIAEAPTRFFVAGMGDALATWFEALACAKSGATNSHAGLPTTAGLGLARTCYDTLMQYGISAKLAVDRNIVNPAVERVIEANILLSGLGFENGGVAAAHGMEMGLRALPETRGTLHGEMVAFGCLAQLVLENYPKADIDAVIAFCCDVGLPVTLEQLGISDRTPEHLMPGAEAACKERPTRNSCSDLSPELVLGTFLGADALGDNALRRRGR